jgi:hypothetical protein
MTDETKIKNASQAIRVLILVGWTMLCGFFFILWMAGIANAPPPESGDPDVVLGAAACVAAGCTGGVWIFGLILGLIIYWLVRR